jgi:hypothetical protein
MHFPYNSNGDAVTQMTANQANLNPKSNSVHTGEGTYFDVTCGPN